jgi:hypothetical protein
MFDFLRDNALAQAATRTATSVLPAVLPGVGSMVNGAVMGADVAQQSSGAGSFLSDWASGIGRDGISALFDPRGAVDREQTRRELADRFQIRGADDAATAENQVTDAEYDRIVRTYSDIRLNRSDIQFNTEGLSEDDATAYRGNMMRDLASIMQTEGGRELVGDLAYSEHDRTTTLSPLFQKNDEGRYDASRGLDFGNGFAQASSSRDRDAGLPTDSRVRINPGDTPIIPPDADRSNPENAWLPWRSDVLLYHELVHSRDHTRGTFDTRIVGDGPNVNPHDVDGHLKQAEYRAAGLGEYAGEAISENAYRRARQGIAASGHGARDGDATMPQRTGYYYHAADDGGGSSGSGSPGTRRMACLGCTTGVGGHDH